MKQEDSELVANHLRLEPDESLTFEKQPECQNVVGQASLGKDIDRIGLLREFPNCDFKESRFQAVTLRIRPPPGATLLVFGNGTIMQMGTSSDTAFNCAIQIFRRELIQRGHDGYSMYPLSFVNRVFSYSTPFAVDISKIEFEDELGCAYVPSLFPGLVYLMFSPRVMFLIFESGSVMLLGIRRMEHLDLAMRHILPVLRAHKHANYNPSASNKSARRKRKRDDAVLMRKAGRAAYEDPMIASKADLERRIGEEYRKLLKKQKDREEKEAKDELDGKNAKKRKAKGAGAGTAEEESFLFGDDAELQDLIRTAAAQASTTHKGPAAAGEDDGGEVRPSAKKKPATRHPKQKRGSADESGDDEEDEEDVLLFGDMPDIVT